MIQAIILSPYYKILGFNCYEGMFIILVVEFMTIIVLLYLTKKIISSIVCCFKLNKRIQS